MGEERYNIKSIREDFKSKGIFYTPPELANYMKSLLPDDVQEIYDPTCGNGSLLSAFGDAIKKYGQDINDEQLHSAEKRLKNFTGVAGDTLTDPAFKGKKFKYIIANPPFSIKWKAFEDERFSNAPCFPPNGKADYAFILHILHYLDEEGKAVVMGFPGILYRGQREGTLRQWIIENNLIEKVIAVPPNQFEDTKIATCIIIFNKAKKTTDIEFSDLESGKTQKVNIDEVRKNDYCLSVNLYIEQEIKKEEIDPVALELSAQKNFLSKLKRELEFSRFVCFYEGLNFKSFLEECEKIIQYFKKGSDEVD